MDVVVKKTIGDAQVSLRAGKFRHGAQRRVEQAAAFPASGKPDATGVQTFLRPLLNLSGVDLDVLAKTLPATPLPSGYRHFRLFEAETGEEWHSAFVVEEGSVLTLHDVLLGALNHPILELAEWNATEWLPDMIPGVLDLEITFVAVPRTSKPFRLRL